MTYTIVITTYDPESDDPVLSSQEEEAGPSLLHAQFAANRLLSHWQTQGFVLSEKKSRYWQLWKSFGDYQVVLEMVILQTCYFN